MKLEVIIFCVLVLCSSIVVSVPFSEALVGQRAYDRQISYDAPRQYENVNIEQPQNIDYYHNRQIYGQQLPRQWQNNEYYNTYQQTRPNEWIPNNQVPNDSFQNSPDQNQFLRTNPGNIAQAQSIGRAVVNEQIQNTYRNYQQQSIRPEPQQFFPTQNNYQETRWYQNPIAVAQTQQVQPAVHLSRISIGSPNHETPVPSPVLLPNVAPTPQLRINNVPVTHVPQERNVEQNFGNYLIRKYASSHEVDQLNLNQDVRKALSSKGKKKRYLFVHPNGTIEQAENLDTITKTNSNLRFVKPSQVYEHNLVSVLSPVTTTPIPTAPLPISYKSDDSNYGYIPYSVAERKSLHIENSITESTPTTKKTTTTTTTTIASHSSKTPKKDEIITLSPIEVPLDQVTTSPVALDTQTTHEMKKLENSLNATTTVSPTVVGVSTTSTPLVTEAYEPTISEKKSHNITESTTPISDVKSTPAPTDIKGGDVSTSPTPNHKNVTSASESSEVVTTTPIPTTVAPSTVTDNVTASSEEVTFTFNYESTHSPETKDTPQNNNQTTNSTSTTVEQSSNEIPKPLSTSTAKPSTLTADINGDDVSTTPKPDHKNVTSTSESSGDVTTPIPSTVAPYTVTENDDVRSKEVTFFNYEGTHSPETKDAPQNNNQTTNSTSTTVKQISDEIPESLSTSTAKPSTLTAAKATKTSEKIDLSKLKSTTNPVWLKTTNPGFLANLTTINEDYNVEYYLDVITQPVIEKDTTTTIYPNGTVIEEYTETKWHDVEDSAPETKKSFKVTNPK